MNKSSNNFNSNTFLVIYIYKIYIGQEMRKILKQSFFNDYYFDNLQKKFEKKSKKSI